MNDLIKSFFSEKNLKDIDTLYEKCLDNVKDGKLYPKAYYFEAMYLYNMYYDAMDGNKMDRLYPSKLKKVIELSNYNQEKPQFYLVNGRYSFRGEITIVELDSILKVLIDYSDIKLITKIMKLYLPYIEKIELLENIYVSLALLRKIGVEMPKTIGQYFMADYFNKCSEMPFYPNARNRLKKIIKINSLPSKAKAMYYCLPQLYDSLSSSGIFDYGVVSLQCFKIIELSIKDKIVPKFSDLSGEQAYDIMPIEIQSVYKRDKFRIERLEIGKIYFFMQNAFETESELSSRMREVFKNKETVEAVSKYINPTNISKYRNAPAHGEYLTEEDASEAIKLLDGFIDEALYMLNND